MIHKQLQSRWVLLFWAIRNDYRRIIIRHLALSLGRSACAYAIAYGCIGGSYYSGRGVERDMKKAALLGA